MFFFETQKRGDKYKILNLFSYTYFIFILCVLLFLLFNVKNSFATITQTSNPNPIITVTFEEPVNISSASLKNNDTGKEYDVVLIENTSNKIFKYKPLENLSEGLYNFTIFYSDLRIEGLFGYETYLFRINFSIPKKPSNLTISCVDNLEAGTSENYQVIATYEDGYNIQISGNNKLEGYLSVFSNNPNILSVSKKPYVVKGVYPGNATITASYLEVTSSKNITVTEPPFIKMLTPWNNGTHAYASSDPFDIIIYTFRNSECKWSTVTTDPNYMTAFDEESDYNFHIKRTFSFLGSSTNFYVYCRALDNSKEETKTYIIRKETDPPIVTLQVNNVYNPIYGTKIFVNDIKAITNKPAVCKYGYDVKETFDYTYPNLDFDSLPNYFLTNNNELESEKDFSKYVINHKVQLQNLEDKTTYRVIVICKGLSNLTSEKVFAEFIVDSGAAPEITILSPPSYISGLGSTSKSINFWVQTNRFASCEYSNNSNFDPKEPMTTTDNSNHKITKTFQIGTHKVYFSCGFFITGEQIVRDYTFTIDNTAPILYYVNDSTEYSNPEQSGSNNTLRFRVKAEDNQSPIVKINYSLWQAGSGNESAKKVTDWTIISFSSDWIKVTGLNLENMTTYYFNVSVINAANLSSNFSFSDGVTINTSLKPLVNLCFNSVFNPENNETGVDCGGNVCEKRCNYGENCSINSDCITGFCNNLTKKCGFANETNTTCNNNKKDGDETDVDCGGSCPRCEEGKKCKKNSDCKSGLECISGKCSSKKECNKEVDEDCDGVEDDFDECPNTPKGEEVNEMGCSESQRNEEKDKDTDDDGMPDWWEKKYGLNPDDPSDANEDLDDDGYTNLEEFNNGTDPTVKNKKSSKQEGSEESTKKKGFPILLLILLIILIGGLIGFLVYTQFVKPKSKKTEKTTQKTKELKLSELKPTQPLTQTQQKTEIPKVEFKQEPIFKKPGEARPLTPEQLAAIRRKARLEEKKRIFKEFEEKTTPKKSEETIREISKSKSQEKLEEISKNKEKVKEEEKEKLSSERGKINPELGILELEMPEEERKKLIDLEGKDVFERLEKLGKRVEGKNIDEELKKLTKGKKDVYKELSKLAEKRKK